MTSVTPTVAANGFAVQGVPPSPPACKRLLQPCVLVDVGDCLLRYTSTRDVEQSHMIDGEWCDEVVGVYEVINGTLTVCDMVGWAREEQQALRDDSDDEAYRASQKYW